MSSPAIAPSCWSRVAVEWPEAEQRIAEVARTRRGRHRDKALASYRRTRALELRAQGKGYAEIARSVGYANKGTAHKVIAQALQAREARAMDVLGAATVMYGPRAVLVVVPLLRLCCQTYRMDELTSDRTLLLEPGGG